MKGRLEITSGIVRLWNDDDTRAGWGPAALSVALSGHEGTAFVKALQTNELSIAACSTIRDVLRDAGFEKVVWTRHAMAEQTREIVVNLRRRA